MIIMNRFLLVFGILFAICWGLLIYAFHRVNNKPIEEVNDPAWACTALGKADLMGLNGEPMGSIAKGDSLNLLAASSDHHNLVMVQTAKGERGWVNNAILPHYYKIRTIDTDEAAHFHNKTFSKKIIGQDFETLEKDYATALQIEPKKKTKKNPDENGFSAIFPMMVITKGSKVVSNFATVEFEDGRAVSVETDSVVNKKAARAKIDPLIFVFLDKGWLVKAGQQANPAYTSYLPEGAEEHSGDSWAEKIGALLLGLILLLSLAVFPVLLVGPLVVVIYLYIEDSFYRLLLAVPLLLASFVLFFTAFSIMNGTVSILLLIANIVAIIGMIIYCEAEVY